MKFKKVSMACLMLVLSIKAAITEMHLYEMGEPGTVLDTIWVDGDTNTVGMLQDSVGDSHCGPEYGKDLGYYSHDPSPVSGVYAGFYTNDWQWGTELLAGKRNNEFLLPLRRGGGAESPFFSPSAKPFGEEMASIS